MQYARQEQQFRLTGYGDRITDVSVLLVSFDKAQRQRRAWLGLATWWALGVATAFIPVAHFVLVPGFFGFGIYSFVQRRRTAVVPLHARGICPDCGQEQDFAIPARWGDRVSLTCPACHRSLRLSPP